MRRCVWSRDLVNEEALAQCGCRPKNKQMDKINEFIYQTIAVIQIHIRLLQHVLSATHGIINIQKKTQGTEM